jgi:hypothetical protein
MSSNNSPHVTVKYISARSNGEDDRSGPLKELGDGQILIDTGKVDQPKFDTPQDTKILLGSGKVETVTPNKTEHLGDVLELNIVYEK